MPKISVYMPNHNYGLYINKAVNSILNQSIDDWELIIIDDGSSDDSLSILDKYKDNKKITIISQENKGLNITNNVAIRLARGKYIVRVDADDYVDENFLLVLSNTLDQNPKVGLVYPDYYCISPDDKIINTIRRKNLDKEVELLDIPAHGACTMFRKDVLLNLGTYNEEFSCQDGYDIWIRFIEKHKPYNVNIPLFYYRQHNASLTKNEHKILDTRRKINKTFIANNGGIKGKIYGFIPVIMSSIYHQNRPFVELDGKPLIWYTLKELDETNYFDNVILSTDNQEVVDYVEENFPKVKALLRMKVNIELESDFPVIILDSLARIGVYDFSDTDSVCIMPVSTPLRKAKHVEHAIDAMEVFKVDTVLSIQEDFSPFYHHDKNGLKPINSINEGEPRLERDAIYKGNGSIILTKMENIKNGYLHGKKIGHINMLPEESVKLNSNYEYWLAEKLIQKNKLIKY